MSRPNETILHLRSPTGRVHRVPAAPRWCAIRCHSADQTAGQWIAYPATDRTTLLLGLHRNRLVEKADRSLVFVSPLVEAGEDFLIILASDGLRVIHVGLDTPKLQLGAFYDYVERWQSLLGVPPSGPSSVSGSECANGRMPDEYEHGFRLVCLASEVHRAVEEIRSELPQHARGNAGLAGIDARATLSAWKSNPTWYRPSAPEHSRSVRCGSRYVLPLRTVPRVSVGGNLFVGAMTVALAELTHAMPPTPSGHTAAGIVALCGRRLASMDLAAPCSPPAARRYLTETRFPRKSEALVEAVAAVAEVARPSRWPHSPGEAGRLPFSLASTPTIFQQVAVIEVLLALGLPVEGIAEALQKGATALGTAWGEYRAWIDAVSHGLTGWRDSTTFPSDYRPDLVVTRTSDGSSLLVDAKLRLGQSEGGLLSASGVKDLQAYMQEYHLQHGVLLVPDALERGCRCEDVVGEGCRIRAIAVPPSCFAENRRTILMLMEEMWNATEGR
jgi:hypothetical protein